MLVSLLADYVERRADAGPSFFLGAGGPGVDSGSGDADRAFWGLFSGRSSSAGVTVNEEAALGYSAFWRGVNLIAGDVGRIPLYVNKRLKPTGKIDAEDHPAYSLLRYQANPYMSAGYFRKVIEGHAITRGNGYAWIERDGAASPKAFWPLDPSKVTPVRANGVLYYRLVTNAGDTRIAANDILHVRGLGYDGLVGYDVITYHRNTLGMGIAARDVGARFFSNDATPGLVLEHPGQLGEIAAKNLRESWEKMHRGVDNKFKMAILEEGMKAHVTSPTMEQSQLVELRDLEVREVANILGVPPYKLGADKAGQSYASIEQKALDYLNDCLDHHFVAWEDECRSKLLTEDEKRTNSHTINFLRNALLQADVKSKNEALEVQFRNGKISLNEWRAIDDEPPIPNGDIRVMNSAYATIETIVHPPEPPEPNKDVPPDQERMRLALRAIVGEAARRMAHRIGLHAERAAKKGGAAFCDWLESGLESEHRATVREALGYPVATLEAFRRRDASEGADVLTRAIFAEARLRFDAATAAKESELTAAVSAAAKLFEEQHVGLIVDGYCAEAKK